jgi:anthranilate phosphoribosyltransferase
MSKTKEVLKKITNKLLLTSQDSDYLAKLIFNERLNNYQMASILTFLFVKGESFAEIFSFVKFLKTKMKKIALKGSLMDTCGTGGDNMNSFNFSTAASIVLSSCDVQIAKHGNRSVTSKSGSFDVLESLGIKIDLDTNQTKRFFEKHNICFLFAPNYHSTLKKFSELRKSLPFRTIFNLLGPLLNPAKLDYQLLGVSDRRNLKTHAECLKKLKIRKAWVVYNINGFDELTTTSKNLIVEVKNGHISKERILDPKEIGFKIRKNDELKGGEASENASLMKRVFEGETGALRDNIVLNSAVGLLISEKVKTINEGIQRIEKKIDDGLVSKKLLSLKKV